MLPILKRPNPDNRDNGRFYALLQSTNVLVLSLAIFLLGVLLTGCSNRDKELIGVWKVDSLINKDAVFEFSANKELYVYRIPGQLGQAFWYGMRVVPEKKSTRTLRPVGENKYSRSLAEQGTYEWNGKNKIKFWQEVAGDNSVVSTLDGPVYEFTSISKTALKIKEWQYSVGEDKLVLIGEMTLVPFTDK